MLSPLGTKTFEVWVKSHPKETAGYISTDDHRGQVWFSLLVQVTGGPDGCQVSVFPGQGCEGPTRTAGWWGIKNER